MLHYWILSNRFKSNLGFFYVAFVRIYIKTDAKNIQQNMFRRLWCQQTRQQIFLKFKDMIYLAKTKTKENIHFTYNKIKAFSYISYRALLLKEFNTVQN